MEILTKNMLIEKKKNEIKTQNTFTNTLENRITTKRRTRFKCRAVVTNFVKKIRTRRELCFRNTIWKRYGHEFAGKLRAQPFLVCFLHMKKKEKKLELFL